MRPFEMQAHYTNTPAHGAGRRLCAHTLAVTKAVCSSIAHASGGDDTQRLRSASDRAGAAAEGLGNRPHTASSTQMSSSSASHRSARPPTRSRTAARSAGEAPASSGYLLAGKLRILWSASSSQTRRPSIQHRKAAADDNVASVSMDSNVRQGQLFAIGANPHDRRHLAILFAASSLSNRQTLVLP